MSNNNKNRIGFTDNTDVSLFSQQGEFTLYNTQNNQLPSEVYWSETQIIPSSNPLFRAGPPSGGTSPGGNPIGPALPLGDLLVPLGLMAGLYLIRIMKKLK